jgi:hypothetical protein
MHSRDAKIANLVGEHLQTKEKTRIGGGGLKRRVENEREMRDIRFAPSSSQIYFLRGKI